jgi:hypothetical protein
VGKRSSVYRLLPEAAGVYFAYSVAFFVILPCAPCSLHVIGMAVALLFKGLHHSTCYRWTGLGITTAPPKFISQQPLDLVSLIMRYFPRNLPCTSQIWVGWATCDHDYGAFYNHTRTSGQVPSVYCQVLRTSSSPDHPLTTEPRVGDNSLCCILHFATCTIFKCRKRTGSLTEVCPHAICVMLGRQGGLFPFRLRH